VRYLVGCLVQNRTVEPDDEAVIGVPVLNLGAPIVVLVKMMRREMAMCGALMMVVG
jgi:hypothetical protein